MYIIFQNNQYLGRYYLTRSKYDPVIILMEVKPQIRKYLGNYLSISNSGQWDSGQVTDTEIILRIFLKYFLFTVHTYCGGLDIPTDDEIESPNDTYLEIVQQM